MSTIAQRSGGVRLVGLITVIAGIVLIIAGGVTWGAVASKLADERITVSADASLVPGSKVDNPISAFSQADIINHHALKATGGKTYAELEKDDPLRATAMNGSFLRSSLFTSVVAFGIAALVMGLGLLFILTGWALRRLASGAEVVTVAPVTPATAAA